MKSAFKCIMANKGAGGVDEVEVGDFQTQVNASWPVIRTAIEDGVYVPSAVRRIEIPKDGGGKRLLGMPTLIDRIIQQAIT